MALVLAEIVLRVGGVSFPIFDAYDEDRALKLMPHKVGIYDKEGLSHLSINSLGYRDGAREREAARGVSHRGSRRFVHRSQAGRARETYWKRLEVILNESPDLGSRRVEVLNFGIGGYGQAEELLTLRKDALGFAPDLVLLGFFAGNDLINNHKSLSIDLRADDFRPFYVLRDGDLVLDSSFRDLRPSLLRRRFLLAATHYLRTLEVVNQVRRNLWLRRVQSRVGASDVAAAAAGPQAPPREMGLSDAHYVPPPLGGEWHEAWEITEALLAEIHRESFAAGASFAVVPIPSASAVHPSPAIRAQFADHLGVPDLLYTEQRLQRIARAHGFEVIQITERLQDRATQKSIHLHGFENTALGTGHWNREAHALAAEMIARDLLERGLFAEQRAA